MVRRSESRVVGRVEKKILEPNHKNHPQETSRLKAGVIGPWGLAALVIGVTSPAIGLYATWGPIEATAGPVAPLVFLAALISVVVICLALFAVLLVSVACMRLFRRDLLTGPAPVSVA